MMHFIDNNLTILSYSKLPFILNAMAAAFTTSVIQHTYAQDTKPTQLPSVVVTASPFANQNELEMAQPVSVLKDDELRRKRESSIGDTLSRELGVSSSSFSPAAGRPIIRGMDGPRIRVLENGIGTLDVSTLSPDHMVTTESLNASQIEILRGPATLLYGSGAAGGVVNVVTDRIPTRIFKKPKGNFELRTNSVSDERTGAFNLNASHKQLSWHLDSFERKTNDYDIPGRANPNDPNSEAGYVRNSYTDSQGLALGGSFIGETGLIGASVSRLENRYGIPGAEQASIDLKQTRYDVSGQLDEPFSGLQSLKVRLGKNNYRHAEIENTGAIGTVFKNNSIEGRVEAVHKPLGGWQGAFGLQRQNRNFSAIGTEIVVPATKSQATGIFLVEEHNWQNFRLELGGRAERTTQKPLDGTNPTRSFDLYSISAGSLWKFISDYNFVVFATRAQRAPSTEELYSNGAHRGTASFEIGNNALRKETSNNIDFGLRKVAGIMTWKVNLYYNRINNYIYERTSDNNNDGVADRVNESGTIDPNGQFVLRNYAQTGAKFYGAEAEAMFDLIRDRLTLRLFSDYVRAKLDNGLNVPRVPPLRFGAEIDYRAGPWESVLSIMRVAKQDKVTAPETVTPGYTMLDAEISYHIKRNKSSRYTLFLQGKNLLDEDARVHASFLKDFTSLAGRALVIGLRGEF